jgi:hypothetical protein
LKNTKNLKTPSLNLSLSRIASSQILVAGRLLLSLAVAAQQPTGNHP